MGSPASQWRKASKISYNKAMRDFQLIARNVFVLVSLVAAVAAPARAQSMIPLTDAQKEALGMQSGMQGHQQLPYSPPAEPVFDEVTFLKLDPPRSMNERIERLIHGIYVDIPPEYDHFGYEVRRYMTSVAGPEILGSPVNLKGQIKNIKSAEIILRYWRQAHQKEIANIEAEMEEKGASSSIRSSLKYNRGIAEAFFVEAQSWTHNNRALLELLLKTGPQGYKFKSHVFTFNDQRDLKKFARLYKARQDALKEIHGYTPFRMMVY